LRQPLRQVRVASFRPLTDELETRARDGEQAGYERGRREGEAALGEQLVRQRAELLELQNGVLDALQQVLPRLTQACEKELIALALEVAQKLVAGLPVSVEMIEAAVREALTQVEESVSFVIQLHPADLALLQQVNSPLLLPAGGMERAQFSTSEAVTRGGCIVCTRFGTIDARRETKVELLRKAILS
jgi:flagellar biosynthesis/type III secretory pathway protein FliH